MEVKDPRQKKSVLFRLDPEVRRAYKKSCVSRGTTMQGELERFVLRRLEKDRRER